VLLARLLESGERTSVVALAEFCSYVAVTVLATVLAERDLLREIFGYLRRAPGGSPAPVA